MLRFASFLLVFFSLSCTARVLAPTALSAAECAKNPQFYLNEVAPILLQCAPCHVQGGYAEGTAFLLVTGDDEANLAAASALAAMKRNGTAALLSKAAEDHGHVYSDDGDELTHFEAIAPSSPAFDTLADWVRRVGGCMEKAASAHVVRDGRGHL